MLLGLITSGMVVVGLVPSPAAAQELTPSIEPAPSTEPAPADDTDLNNPSGLAVDAEGNLYIADSDSHRIRRVDADTGTISTIAGTGNGGFSGDGSTATAADLDHPAGITFDIAGNLYIADTGNHRIRLVDADTGIITTVAGNGAIGSAGDGDIATDASLNTPLGVAVDTDGNVFIADTGNNKVRTVSGSTGLIDTIAGDGTYGFYGDNGPGIDAAFSGPTDVAVDSDGNVVIADTGNNRIRQIDATTGIVTTLAGSGNVGYMAIVMEGYEPSIGSELLYPAGVAIDAAGNLFIADTGNHRVRLLSAASHTISTVVESETSDDGPRAIAVDADGNVYIAESNNNRIRLITSTEPEPTPDPVETITPTPPIEKAPAVVEPAPRPTLGSPYADKAGNHSSVSRLYMAVFSRQPDAAGHTFWLERTNTDMTLWDIARYFVASEEFTLTYDKLDNVKFVNLLYVNVMGRNADSAGAAYWVGMLDSGLDRGGVTLMFSESAEFKILTKTT